MSPFPNAVDFSITSSQVLIIGGLTTAALVLGLVALGVIFKKETVTHSEVVNRKGEVKRIKIALVIAVLAGLAAGGASLQWTMVEAPYHQAEKEAKAQMSEAFKMTGATVISKDYDVKVGEKSDIIMDYQGSTLYCEVNPKSTDKPIEVLCGDDKTEKGSPKDK